jgi:hypothetical protein
LNIVSLKAAVPDTTTLRTSASRVSTAWLRHLGRNELRKSGVVLAALAAAASPSLAFASTISFDCDVPADRYSSVSQDADGQLSVRGLVKLVAARSGANLPVAGARLVSSDGKSSAGFQIVGSGSKPDHFDVVLNLNKNGDLKRYAVGQIDTEATIPFTIASQEGRITLDVGGKKVAGDFMPLSGGKMMVFCSTAQFKFSDVAFGMSSAGG